MCSICTTLCSSVLKLTLLPAHMHGGEISISSVYTWSLVCSNCWCCGREVGYGQDCRIVGGDTLHFFICICNCVGICKCVFICICIFIFELLHSWRLHYTSFVLFSPATSRQSENMLISVSAARVEEWVKKGDCIVAKTGALLSCSESTDWLTAVYCTVKSAPISTFVFFLNSQDTSWVGLRARDGITAENLHINGQGKGGGGVFNICLLAQCFYLLA